MTLFTEGRLQAFERMMRDTGKYRRRDDEDDRPKIRKKPGGNKPPVGKGGGGHAGIQG